MISLIQEFYASLKHLENNCLKGNIHLDVTVKGKQVDISPRNICEYYNAPYHGDYYLDLVDLKHFSNIGMEHVMSFLIENQGVWKRQPTTNFLLTFNQAIMFPLTQSSYLSSTKL